MSDAARYQDPEVIQRVLHQARTVAIVGLSRTCCAPATSSASTPRATATA